MVMVMVMPRCEYVSERIAEGWMVLHWSISVSLPGPPFFFFFFFFFEGDEGMDK
jgi:hypothetical protein